MDQIVITDTIGAQNRPFVFPRYDGKITLNLGPGGFRDPLKIMTAPNGRLAEGEVFIHELTHAWQIRHTPMPLDWLAQALAARLCEISGGDPFHHYDPAGKPYSEFGMEEQAQIVQDWFAGNKHPDGTRFPPGSQLDPFFRYIQQNIRTGNYD